MDEVKVKREKLLEVVRKNRKAHRDLFLKAQEGYRKDMIAELDQMLQDAKDGKQIRRAVMMPEPQDHTADYDRVITMLEMSVDKEIELDSEAFDNYVMDNWAWRAHAMATNTMYASKAGRRK